jgi:hypothetical protein
MPLLLRAFDYVFEQRQRTATRRSVSPTRLTLRFFIRDHPPRIDLP